MNPFTFSLGTPHERGGEEGVNFFHAHACNIDKK